MKNSSLPRNEVVMFAIIFLIVQLTPFCLYAFVSGMPAAVGQSEYRQNFWEIVEGGLRFNLLSTAIFGIYVVSILRDRSESTDFRQRHAAKGVVRTLVRLFSPILATTLWFFSTVALTWSLMEDSMANSSLGTLLAPWIITAAGLNVIWIVTLVLRKTATAGTNSRISTVVQFSAQLFLAGLFIPVIIASYISLPYPPTISMEQIVRDAWFVHLFTIGIVFSILANTKPDRSRSD